MSLKKNCALWKISGCQKNRYLNSGEVMCILIIVREISCVSLVKRSVSKQPNFPAVNTKNVQIGEEKYQK